MSDSLPVARRLADNRPFQLMLAIYGLFWLLCAWSPVDRQTWLLENLLVFGLAAALVLTHNRFAFSNLSNGLIVAFLLLHAVGSHYTYSEVPLGHWVRDNFDLSRNHYDRVVHFGFGLLLAYPLREFTLRRVHARGVWAYAGPLLVILAMSSSYEIMEWVAARFSNPELGVAYVGAQGDVWDGQKDMVLAFAGACLAMACTALHRRLWQREPYLMSGS